MNVAGLGVRATSSSVLPGMTKTAPRSPQCSRLAGFKHTSSRFTTRRTTSKLRDPRRQPANGAAGHRNHHAAPIHSAYAALLEKAMCLLPIIDGIILSDYAKGTLTAENCHEMISAARQAGLPILVDPKGRDFRLYRGATTICPNLLQGSSALTTGETGASLGGNPRPRTVPCRRTRPRLPSGHPGRKRYCRPAPGKPVSRALR